MPALDPTQGPMATLMGLAVVVGLIVLGSVALNRAFGRWADSGRLYPTIHITAVHKLFAWGYARKDHVRSCRYDSSTNTMHITATEAEFDSERARGRVEGKVEFVPLAVWAGVLVIASDLLAVLQPSVATGVLLVLALLVFTTLHPPEVTFETEVVPRVAD